MDNAQTPVFSSTAQPAAPEFSSGGGANTYLAKSSSPKKKIFLIAIIALFFVGIVVLLFVLINGTSTKPSQDKQKFSPYINYLLYGNKENSSIEVGGVDYHNEEFFVDSVIRDGDAETTSSYLEELEDLYASSGLDNEDYARILSGFITIYTQKLFSDDDILNFYVNSGYDYISSQKHVDDFYYGLLDKDISSQAKDFFRTKMGIAKMTLDLINESNLSGCLQEDKHYDQECVNNFSPSEELAKKLEESAEYEDKANLYLSRVRDDLIGGAITIYEEL